MTDDIRRRVQASLGDAFLIERELGGGGMSRTYVALEKSLERRVVVKVLSPELAAGVSVERFKREILLAAQLQHPHVVPVLSSGDADGLPWFTMPYVEGDSLRSRLGHGPLATGEAVSILRDVARALAFAHSHGVVHRDIKPDNVLLSQGSATVTDFGIAKAISAARTESHATLTMAGTSLGSPAYMAPEQAAGDPDVDHRADIYAFGCMAYELLAGRPPFQASSPSRLLGAHLGEQPKELRELSPGVPPQLAGLVMQCLEKDPAKRPQQATDLVRVLDSVTSSGTTASAPSILAGRIHIGRAVALWTAGTAIVALTAWAATVVIGLPDWVLPGSIGVMLAGLPIIGFTAWVQRVAQRTYTATPTFTPGGGTTAVQMGTLHTIAIAASPHVSWKRTWAGGAIAVGGFVALVGGFMVLRAFGIGPAGSLVGAGKLSANGQIIITDFKSPADDSTLGLTITEALRADLAQSTFLRVMPRRATADVMRLMQRKETDRVDFDLARSIASREGIKAVLDGDIVSLGGRYILSTRLISSQDGSQLAAFKEEAESQNDLIPAIGRLGKQLRAKVGESLKSVRETGALDRVTTGSLQALRKYAAGNMAFEQTGDYLQAIPLLEEAVAIDTSFAMAWRRLASYYNNIGQFEKRGIAVTKAYRHSDRLSEVERHLTAAAYWGYGPEADDAKSLAAYQAALAIDSLNGIALNNAANLLGYTDVETAAKYYMRTAAQPDATPIAFQNAVSILTYLHRDEQADSLQREFMRRMPTNAMALVQPVLTAATRGEYDRAAELQREVLPKIAGSRTVVTEQLGISAGLALVRGKLRDAARIRAEQRTRQAASGLERNARLDVGLDSVLTAATVLEDPGAARALLDRALRRAPIDSIPFVERNYGYYLGVAALVGDTSRARQWHAESKRAWQRAGKIVQRPSSEALDDAFLALAQGRNADARAALDAVDQDEAAVDPTLFTAVRFLALDRMQRSDSTIAAGETYLSLAPGDRLDKDAYFRAGILQRLGELYEAKGDLPKALARFQAFVELWKDADPELQPRVREVRARIERIRQKVGPRG